MAKGARVQSVQQLADFRAFLVKFAEGVHHGVGLGDSEVHATGRWLKEEHPARLNAERHKAQRALQTATDDLRRKRLQPTATGDPPSTVTEQKVFAKAKAKMQWLEDKAAATQKWARQFDREAIQYQAALQSARSLPGAMLPRALGRLEAHLVAIEQYLQVQTKSAAAGRVGDGDAAAINRPASESDADAGNPADEDRSGPETSV